MTELKENLQILDFCNRGVFTEILKQRPYAIVFKTTNWCWNNCAHCCESSGPKNPKTFIPRDVITGYIDQAVNDENFSKHIILTGGEIMAAYKFVDEYYVPDILDHALDKNLGVDIKTNAGWAGTPVGEQIFADIKNIMLRHRPRVLTSKNKDTTYPLYISLSLDRFHPDCMERNFKLIEQLSKKKITGATYALRISSFDFDRSMFDEFLKKLTDAGITVQKATLVDSKGNEIKTTPRFLVNGHLALEYSGDAILFNGGRAKDIPGAYHNPTPQFTFMEGDHYNVLVAFDSFGNVTLGAAEGEKITVPWRDSDGAPRPLINIQTDLISATKIAEQKYIKRHSLLNSCRSLISKIVK